METKKEEQISKQLITPSGDPPIDDISPKDIIGTIYITEEAKNEQ